MAMPIKEPNAIRADKTQFSIVVAIYNGEEHLERFFSSLISQSIGFSRNIEIIAVDDGSRDDSQNIVKKYSSKYPENIRYFYKDNGGQSSARNFGLQYVSGQWVSFIDQDDFLHIDYFRNVAKFIRQQLQERSVSVIWTRHMYFHEKTQKVKDNHLLKHCFNTKNRLTNIRSEPQFFQPFTSSAFIPSSLIKKHGLSFDERVFPGSEDIRFLIDLFSAEPESNVAFLQEAIFYRFRNEKRNSCLDTSWQNIRKYNEVLKFGVYEPLQKLGSQGAIPEIIKNLALYEVSSHIRFHTNKNEVLLSEELTQIYCQLLQGILDLLDHDAVINFARQQGERLLNRDHLGILQFLFGKKTLSAPVFFSEFDSAMQLACFTAYTFAEDSLTFIRSGKEILPFSHKKIPLSFTGKIVASWHVAWIPFQPSEHLRVTVGAAPTQIDCSGIVYEALPPNAITTPKNFDSSKLPWRVKLLRKIMGLSFIRKRYKNCWLFVDRDFIADDNAEHLYRWVQKHDPKRRIRFLLNKNSPDWKRLQRDGFKLVQFGSLQHYILLSACEWFISSHVNGILFRPFFKKYYGDLSRYRFCFLQHGIIKDDLSQGLNRWPIDMFITSAQREYNSIVNEYPYKNTAKEVRLTGLPRHDSLLKMAEGMKQPTYIIIAPTWRSYLVGSVLHTKTFKRSHIDSVLTTRFFTAWRDVIQDVRLSALAKSHGLQILFLPHPDIATYAADFIGDSDVRCATSKERYQEILCRCAVLLTDYSSVAFEVGLLKRPVFYYQFDKDEFFASHTYKPGYFDYERDGFGEIATTHDQLLSSVSRCLDSGCKNEKIYSKRSDAFFTFKDRKNCERIYTSLVEMDSTNKPLNKRYSERKMNVITYGTYDLLHIGHIKMLKRCKALGDRLIVALSTDEFNLKMKDKVCVQPYHERKEILEALKYVDLVIPEENWEQKMIDVERYCIDTFVIGDDWEGKFDFLKEKCKVIYLPRTEGISTTMRKEEIVQRFSLAAVL